MSIKNFTTALRTNEDGARTKTIIAVVITAAAVAAGIALTKMNAPTPVVLLVEEATELITDPTT